MQEEVEQKTVTLAVNAVKFTGRILKEAISRHVQNKKMKSRDKTCAKPGRITMRQLQKQYGDLRSVTVDDENTRDFERIARKYHVQYKMYRCEKNQDSAGESGARDGGIHPQHIRPCDAQHEAGVCA